MKGRYNLAGMRVGGPYTIEVFFYWIWQQTQQTIFTLSLGENYALNVELTEEAQNIR